MKAKAKAALMDQNYENAKIDEVIIVMGPDLDSTVTMNLRGDGTISKEVFTNSFVAHKPGRYGIKGNVMCITVPVEERDKKFIMDSGSGHDLISKTKVERMDFGTYRDQTVNFHTANGITSTDQKTDIKFQAFGQRADAHVLDDTPSISYV